MKRRHFYLSSTIATLLYILSVWAPSANAATFTSSLPLEPNSLLQPFGETLVVTLPEGFLDLPELPENEYYGNVSYEYHWQVSDGPCGEGRTATIFSSTSGYSNEISSPGCYTLTFSGKATYTIFWQEDGVEKANGPHEVALTPSPGGRLAITFWLIATLRIDISGNGASGQVSDRTSNLLQGTKYTFTAYRTPANSPDWPSGYPVWSSSGIGISTNGEECVGTFYTGGDDKTLTATCGAISKTATFNSVTPQIQRVEFHWDSQGIDIYDKEDKWQAGIGGLSAINDPACYVQGEKGKARLKFYADKNLTFPVTVSLRGDVHWLDEYITGEDYGRDTMTFGTDWTSTCVIESEANAEAKIKDDYDVDISWRYKVRAPNGSDEWIDTGDTDNLRYYLVLAKPQAPQERPWNRVLEMAVDWTEGDESVEEALGHVTEEIYNSGFVYETNYGRINYSGTWVDIGTSNERFIPGFRLTACLAQWGDGHPVNCTDTANMVCIFGNALGCNSNLYFIASNYKLNYIKAIGCNWTNSPFVSGSQYFSYHHTGAISTNIYDACLQIDNDSDPSSPPHLGVLPVNMPFSTYKSKLVDASYIESVTGTPQSAWQLE